ncbi:MAG: hypothetical protein IMX06_06270 [Kyrpidia tusciae]|nr:hypothetical protein [Kyrpidia tusciae]MBE3552450.1 hypothetical protein [Kyrpidia tusciae]
MVAIRLYRHVEHPPGVPGIDPTEVGATHRAGLGGWALGTVDINTDG